MGKWSLIGFLPIVGLVMSNCGTMKMYAGPELPREKVAVIKSKGPVLIHTVDGYKLRGFNLYFAVKPGPHVVVANMWEGRNILSNRPLKTQTLTFRAEAGQTYAVDGYDPTRSFWIVHEESDRVVAGEREEY